MLNINKTYQRAHGDIDVKIKDNQISKFFQSGSAKVFYPKCHDEIKELVLVNTAGGWLPDKAFNKDVLPTPFEPIKHVISPIDALREISYKICEDP
jgi:hypothetical protein